jgi:hypothetical protein
LFLLISMGPPSKTKVIVKILSEASAIEWGISKSQLVLRISRK